MRKRFELLIGLIVFTCLNACKKEIINILPEQRYTMPLTITYSNQQITPSVKITINGFERDVLFDTGSFGLRIMKNAVGIDSALGPRVMYHYGSANNQMQTVGSLEGAYFSLGSSSGSVSIRFMAIDSVTDFGKNNLHPFPANETVDPAFRNFSGILGVGLRYDNTGAANPLAQLPGSGKYIVQYPAFKSTNGTLIINPNDNDLKGFILFKLNKDNYLIPNGDNSWLDNQIKGIITINGVIDTSATWLDTGTSPIAITSNTFAAGEVKNSSIAIGLIPMNSTMPAIQYAFNTNADPVLGQNLVTVSAVTSGAVPRHVLGSQLFFAYDVMFDQVNGYIGLRKK